MGIYTKRLLLLTLILTFYVNMVNAATDQYSIVYNIPTDQIPVSTCKNLNQEDAIYTLITNISSVGTCFTIGANNITLEGQGHIVNYSTTGSGYGLVNIGGYDNIIIRNLNLVQIGTGATYSHGIYFKNVANSRIENISINIKGSSSRGIHVVSSSSNYFSDFDITTSNIGGSYGIYSLSSSSNVFTSFNISTTGSSSHGLYIKTSNNNRYYNYNISTLGTSAYGIYDNGNGNDFSNINIVSNYIGFYIISAGDNIVKDSSIISKLSYDYYLRNIGTSNSFIKTNFTTRKVYLYDNVSSFNYSNDNGIWLNSIQIRIPTATLYTTRSLINWTKTNTSWQEKLSSSRRLRYNMKGLLTNQNYSIWNGTIIDYNLTTDNNGNLPIFDINFTTSAKVIKIVTR